MAASDRKCFQCGKEPKYCCPRCSTRSCSLPCVKLHKRNQECDGIRDKTAYVPLSDFTDLDLLSDYRFLEESTRVVDTAHRSGSTLGVAARRGFLPGHLHKLQTASRQKGIQLKFLPKCFTKRRENTSWYDIKEKCTYWHIVWEFVDAKVKVHDKRIPETDTLGECLDRHLNTDTCSADLRPKLAMYQAGGSKATCVLMAVEGKHASYYQLDISATVEDNLKGKAILEYPTFVVVPRDHVSSYKIVGNDVEKQEVTGLPSFFSSNPNVSSDSSGEE
ncbi:box C/D snoRNA protein 1-like [Ornithodoros turicata]